MLLIDLSTFIKALFPVVSFLCSPGAYSLSLLSLIQWLGTSASRTLVSEWMEESRGLGSVA